MATEETANYEDQGDISIEGADDANVPVDIWLTQIADDAEDEDRGRRGWWRLRANNYMPRKGYLGGEHSYLAISKDREVLAALVRVHWLPLYQTAVKVLTEMKPNEEGTACLYYWQDK